jgi:hypothetical protein
MEEMMVNEMKCEAIVTVKVRMLVPGQPNSVGANAAIYDFLDGLRYGDGMGEYYGPGQNVEVLQMEVCDMEMSLAEGHQ